MDPNGWNFGTQKPRGECEEREKLQQKSSHVITTADEVNEKGDGSNPNVDLVEGLL